MKTTVPSYYNCYPGAHPVLQHSQYFVRELEYAFQHICWAFLCKHYIDNTSYTNDHSFSFFKYSCKSCGRKLQSKTLEEFFKVLSLAPKNHALSLLFFLFSFFKRPLKLAQAFLADMFTGGDAISSTPLPCRISMTFHQIWRHNPLY